MAGGYVFRNWRQYNIYPRGGSHCFVEMALALFTVLESEK